MNQKIFRWILDPRYRFIYNIDTSVFMQNPNKIIKNKNTIDKIVLKSSNPEVSFFDYSTIKIIVDSLGKMTIGIDVDIDILHAAINSKLCHSISIFINSFIMRINKIIEIVMLELCEYDFHNIRSIPSTHEISTKFSKLFFDILPRNREVVYD